jgi:hypothetical protein
VGDEVATMAGQTATGDSVICTACELCLDLCGCDRYPCERCGGSGWDRAKCDPKVCRDCDGTGKLGIVKEER